MKVYQVIFQDEWNNLYHLGFFKDLNDAVPAVNEMLSSYDDIEKLNPGDLTEYPSTFSAVFDREFYSEDEGTSVSVRGFIFDDFDQEAYPNVQYMKPVFSPTAKKENDDYLNNK